MKPNRKQPSPLTYETAIVGKRMLADEILRCPDAVIIRYVHSWGGSFDEKHFWQAEIGDEIWDWNSKENLITELTQKGLRWIVLRHHLKDYEYVTIMQKG